MSGRATPRPRGLDELAAYARLGVGEVWFWREGAIEVFVGQDGGFARREASMLLPGLDLRVLAGLLAYQDQGAGVKRWRQALRDA